MHAFARLFARCGLFALVAAAALAPTAARAQAIVNVAQLEWDAGASRQVRRSNEISIAVTRPPPGRLTLHGFAATGGGQPLDIGDSVCPLAASPAQPRDIAPPAALRPASVETAKAIHAGDAIVLRVDSPADNRDRAAVETLRVTITGADGDRETVTLTETGADTGIFTSYILTAATPPAAVRDDCRLSVDPGRSLTIDATRGDTGSAIGAPVLDILVDPAGIAFDSGDGTPVAGERGRLYRSPQRAPLADRARQCAHRAL